MIIAIPALGVIVQQAIQAIAVGAVIGAATGAGAGAVVEGVQSANEHGEINQQVLSDAARGALQGGRDGALIGGAFGPIGLAVGPAIGVAGNVVDDVAGPAARAIGTAAKPVASAVDDAARPVIKVADDAVRPAIQAADDAIRPALNGIRDRAKSFGGSVGAAFNHARNSLNARFYTRLPKGAGNSGYVYVMDDVANSGRYKIGKTIDPPTRIKAVQGKLNKAGGGKLEYSCIIPTNNMSGLENSLLKEFSAQNLRNFPAGTEWFKLDAAQLAAACSR